ncbi:MAG: hypothetical protein AB1656_10715 [Candidatus Omnitrophota bacterium]
MKLITRNRIAILPIFLGAILIIGISKYFSERDEMIWSARHEIASFAISIAEFIDPVLLPNLESEVPADSETSIRLLLPLQRIFASNSLRHIAIYSRDGQRMFYSLGEPPLRPAEELWRGHLPELAKMAADAEQKTQVDEYAIIGEIAQGKENGSLDAIDALAPVSDGRGRLAAIVFLEKDVSEISSKTKAIIVQMAIAAVFILIVGLVVVQTITTVITKPIRRLTNAILAGIKGRHAHSLEQERIREFYDLGNTYNTMVCVLDETEGRIGRNLVQSEQFFSRTELSRAFRDVFWPDRECASGMFTAKGSVFGRSSREFFDIDANENGLWAVVCRLSGVYSETYDLVIGKDGLSAVPIRLNEGDLDVALSSASLSVLLKGQLAGGDPQSAYEMVSALYAIEYFHCVQATNENGLCRIWRWKEEDKTLHYSEQTLKSGENMILHSFSGDAEETIEIFMRFFNSFTPQKLVGEILRSLDEDSSGAIVAIKRNDDFSYSRE